MTYDSVLAADVETGERRRLRIEEIDAAAETAATAALGKAPLLEDVPEGAWALAQRRFDVIKDLVDAPHRRRDAVEDAAAAAGVSTAAVYGWIGRFEKSGHLSSLLPRKGGRRTGDTKISAAMEVTIQTFIETEFLTKQQKIPQAVVDAVRNHCKRNGLTPPGDNTVRRRVEEVSQELKLRRRGDRDGARRLRGIVGSYPETTHPLEVVQIDHTLADVVVVGEDREPLGRPWLTLAIDVHTRMVVGYWIDIERPNANAVGLCICMMVLPKAKVIEALGVMGEWPVWGRPGKVLVDNAKDFDNRTLERACRQHGIGQEFRPPATPHYGGHIERLMGTMATLIRNLPGATYSNPKERGRYDSEREAALTIDEFETWLVNHIVNVYNAKLHKGIGTSPLAKWREAIMGVPGAPGRGLPPLYGDPERLRLDFLPFEERTVQAYGIRMDHILYWSGALQPWIGAVEDGRGTVPRKFTVRRDPRKISPVYFWDPDLQEYLAIPYANPGRPVVSLWELRATMQRLRAKGVKDVDEQRIMEALEVGDQIVADARRKTKAARKDDHRRRMTKRAMAQAPSDPANLRTPAPKPTGLEGDAPGRAAGEGDIYSVPAEMPALIDLGPGWRG